MPTIYDSTNPSALPTDGDAYLGYVDGAITDGNYAAVKERFPDKPVIGITTVGTPNTPICDCEKGDLTFEGAMAWAQAELDEGRQPTIYVSRSNLDNVYMGAQVFYFIADYLPDAQPHEVPPAVAVQYASNNDFDTSEVYDLNWFALVTGQPLPNPPTEKDDDPMLILRNADTNAEILIVGEKACYIGSLDDSAALSANVPNVTVTGAFYDLVTNALGGVFSH